MFRHGVATDYTAQRTCLTAYMCSWPRVHESLASKREAPSSIRVITSASESGPSYLALKQSALVSDVTTGDSERPECSLE